jgi:hypothetical protein
MERLASKLSAVSASGHWLDAIIIALKSSYPDRMAV